ncbi:hypothetical protein Airi02_074700 [Actinoallomurus iriomotensis]|uniref:Uncharacterized protein n=1 Tax=Actinoallomurus iriomotensis TaxID=478107 RepID=A0A9W6W504_9ACTN|nr:hypothetical protein Airi02_074700 [Actinoallomurus iriomotensis]
MDAPAAAGTAITVATATASASSQALSLLAAGSAAARTDTRRVRRALEGWGMQAFLSGGNRDPIRVTEQADIDSRPDYDHRPNVDVTL